MLNPDSLQFVDLLLSGEIWWNIVKSWWASIPGLLKPISTPFFPQFSEFFTISDMFPQFFGWLFGLAAKNARARPMPSTRWPQSLALAAVTAGCCCDEGHHPPGANDPKSCRCASSGPGRRLGLLNHYHKHKKYLRIYMCTSCHIVKHRYIYTYVYLLLVITFTHTYIYNYIYCVYIYVYVYMCVYPYVYIYIHTYT